MTVDSGYLQFDRRVVVLFTFVMVNTFVKQITAVIFVIIINHQYHCHYHWHYQFRIGTNGHYIQKMKERSLPVFSWQKSSR